MAVISAGFDVNSSGYTLATKIPWTPCIRWMRWIKRVKSELKVRIFKTNTNRDLSGNDLRGVAPCNYAVSGALAGSAATVFVVTKTKS